MSTTYVEVDTGKVFTTSKNATDSFHTVWLEPSNVAHKVRLHNLTQGEEMDLIQIKQAIKEAADESVGQELVELRAEVMAIKEWQSVVNEVLGSLNNGSVEQSISKALKQVDGDADWHARKSSDHRDAFGRRKRR